ncbi:MAG: hypothetical protein DHS20C14_22530 [Phycisphaeraceae bacterium]|nr:MAG: hypothetical protein DHS20C14_22530 [Phycisphaeraceae bacterium]
MTTIQRHTLLAVGACVAASVGVRADMVTYAGKVYETVDWVTVDDAGETATGTAAGVGVTFDTPDIAESTIFSADYSTDPSYDALSFVSGTSESLHVKAGAVGTSTLTFDTGVSEVLILIGLPGDEDFSREWGAALWDFADAQPVSIVDSEAAAGFTLGAGNVISNSTDATDHESGAILVGGLGTTLSWDQSSSSGRDSMNFTIAVLVPAPGGALVLAGALIPACRRRRR